MLGDHPLIGIPSFRRAKPAPMSDGPDGSAMPGCAPVGQRELPAIVAAAVLMTIDAAGPTRGGAPGVSGCLPEHLCEFDGTVWHDTWTSDGTGVWMTPVGGGAAVRFTPPPGFAELCRAIELLVVDLRPRIRGMILLAHPSLEFGDVVEDHVAGPLLAEFGGRFSALVAEVWCELQKTARTAHGRMTLATERGMLEAADR